MKSVVALALLAALCLLLGMGCEEVAGIKDREFVDAGAGGSGASGPEPPSELCAEYCDTVMEACTDEFTLYSGLETCYGVCGMLPEGDALEIGGNNVHCRLAQAKNAISSREPEAHCEAAGPGGNGVCGTNCESYCHLFEQACPEDYEVVENCIDKCEGLRDTERFDVVVDYDGDSLQCRLVHLSSATVDPEGHCHHGWFAPVDRCYDPAEDAPDCEEYCNLIDVACTGDLAQYENKDQCLSICQVLDPGEIQHLVENTVGCRKYHSYSSLAVPETHCFHAGPLGDGHCGHDDPEENFKSNCESYCQILEAACTSDFDDKFADQQECWDDCADQPEDFLAGADSLYTITAEGTDKNTLQCRMLHLSRAFEDDSECAAAMGGDPCD